MLMAKGTSPGRALRRVPDHRRGRHDDARETSRQLEEGQTAVSEQPKEAIVRSYARSELAPLQVQQRLGVQPGEHRHQRPRVRAEPFELDCRSQVLLEPTRMAPDVSHTQQHGRARRRPPGGGRSTRLPSRSRCSRPTACRRPGRPARSAVAPAWRSARHRAQRGRPRRPDLLGVRTSERARGSEVRQGHRRSYQRAVSPSRRARWAASSSIGSPAGRQRGGVRRRGGR